MVRARCPDCDEAGRGDDALVEVVDTGQRRHPTRGTDRWWSIVLHSDGQGTLCPGSGKRV